MSDFKTVKAQIRKLIDTANEKTGKADADLTTAVNTLISGYNSRVGNYAVAETISNISAETEIMCEDIRLNYIQSTGTQYFDTGILPDANTEIEIQYSVQEIMSLGPHVLSADWFSFPFPRLKNGTPCFLASRFGNEVWLELKPTVDTIYTIKGYPSNKIIVNNVECATLEAGSTPAPGNVYLFTWGGGPGNSSYTGKLKVYYCKIWQNGILVRDFVPYWTAKNEIGMLDLVENKLYTSIGTGQFIGG